MEEVVSRTSMLSTSIGPCGGVFGDGVDVDVLGVILAPDRGIMSSLSLSSMIIGEVRDPIPRTIMAASLKETFVS